MGIIQICSIIIVSLSCLLIFLLIKDGIKDAIKEIAFNVTCRLYELKQSDFEKLAHANRNIVPLMRRRVKKVLFNLEKRGIVKKDGDTFFVGDNTHKALFVTIIFKKAPKPVTPYVFANRFGLDIKEVEDLLSELVSDDFVQKEGRFYTVGAKADEMLL